MKKIIIFALCICLCSAFISCVGNKLSDNVDNSNQSILSKDSEPEQGETKTPVCTEMAQLRIKSLEEYRILVDSGKLPGTFVPYEKISEFGTFESMTFISNTFSGDFSWYYYTLIDSLGYRIYLDIQSDGKDEYIQSPNVLTAVESADMRNQNIDKSVIVNNKYDWWVTYNNNGLVYHYKHGKLDSVKWISDGVAYQLQSSESLCNYSETHETVTGKILDSRTATGAISKSFVVDRKAVNKPFVEPEDVNKGNIITSDKQIAENAYAGNAFALLR